MSASFLATAAWGLTVVFAFVGWGGELEVRVFRTQSADAGLRGAWGMALALFVMSFLALFSLASRWAILIFVAIGAILGIIHAVRRPRVVVGWGNRLFAIIAAICIAAALLQFFDAICDVRFNLADDYIAYFSFAKQIVQRGTLFDPFNTRLVMSYGGQSFLHAIALVGTPSFRLHVLDEGICFLLVILLITGSRKVEQPAWPALLALLFFSTLPHIKINTHSQFSGVVLFYALFRTLVWVDDIGKPVATAALIALIGAAACSIRSNFLAAAIPMIGISYMHALWRSSDRQRWIRETAVAAGFGLLFLAPWMILAFRSAGTPLFPLIHGHFNTAFPMLQSPTNFTRELSDLLDSFAQNTFAPMLPLFALAAVLLPERSERAPLRSLLVASAIGWLLLISALASDVPSFLRYVYGFIVALILATIGRSATTVRLGLVATLIAVAGQLIMKSEHAIQRTTWMFDRVTMAARVPLRRPETTPLGLAHQRLQARVPPGANLLIAVDYPYMFDYRRNRIFDVDTAAAVSPPPGWPYFRGSESVARYLRESGVRYFAFVKPQSSIHLFSRETWLKQLHGPETLWHFEAPIFLDMFDNFERLARSYRVVYDDGSLILLDLNSATPTPPQA